MQIRAAHAASVHAHEHLALVGIWLGHVLEPQWIRFNRRGGVEQTCLHGATSTFGDAATFSLVLSSRAAKCCTLERNTHQTPSIGNRPNSAHRTYPPHRHS